MQDWLAAQASIRPQGIALIAEGQRWTYADLDKRAGEMAAALSASDIQVRAGDRVGVLLPNCTAYVVLIHALARLGAILVPFNTRLTAAELAAQIETVKVRLLITNADMQQIAIQAAKGASACLVENLLHQTNQVFQPQDIDLDHVQAIIFTSGTTGQAKGALITFGNQMWSAMGSAYRLGTLPEDRWLCCLPLFHVGGLAIIMRCCLYGTTVILQQGTHHEIMTRLIADHSATLISLVPTILQRTLKEPIAVQALQRLRLVLLGGAATSAEVIRQCETLRIPIAPTYGLTEACSQVVTMLPDESRRKPGSVGKPLLFSRIEIVDEHGNSLPPNTRGEVVVIGNTVMLGYYDQPQATAQTICAGKLYTGDIGYLDDDGDLWLVQRRSDLIVSGGENVYPVEVEQVLQQHPAVEAVCVVGIPDPEWGQRVAASVVLKADSQATAAELIEFCRRSLAGYKLPRLIRFVDSLPMTESGKIRRRAVMEMLAGDAKPSD